jgi:CheY-like chemotaxis protein
MQIKILVVDDSSSDRVLIGKLLSEYDVLTACDGVEAMQKIDEDEESHARPQYAQNEWIRGSRCAEVR